jgi:hypothetical protein
LDALHALASVGERKKEEHTRALACLASPGRAGLRRRVRARDVRVNGPSKSGPILAGTRLYFATSNLLRISRAEFWDSVTDLVFGTPKTIAVPSYKYARLPFVDLFCHFKYVTDITRGILGLVTDLFFGMPKP